MISALSLVALLAIGKLPESWSIMNALPQTEHNGFLVQGWSVFEQAFEGETMDSATALFRFS